MLLTWWTRPTHNCRASSRITRDSGAIGAEDVPSRLILNKVDRLTEPEREELALRSSDAWLVSCKNPGDISEVRTRLIEFFESSYIEGELLVPYDRQRLVSQMHENGKVLEKTRRHGVRVRLRRSGDMIASGGLSELGLRQTHVRAPSAGSRAVESSPKGVWSGSARMGAPTEFRCSRSPRHRLRDWRGATIRNRRASASMAVTPRAKRMRRSG